MVASLLSSALLVATAASAAHTFDIRAKPTEPVVQFDYPANRGWDASTLSIGPCQGFKVGGRSDYPLSGGQFALEQSRDAHQVQISYSTLSDPQLVSDFTPIGNNLTQIYSGSSCLAAPDFGALGLSAGQQMTLKVEFYTGPQNTSHYSCSDVTLVDLASYIKPTYECTNVTESTQTRDPKVSNPNLNKSAPKVLQLAEAGGIGAGVTLAVVALLLAAAWKFGYAAFGKPAIEKRKWEADAHVMGDRKSINTENTGNF